MEKAELDALKSVLLDLVGAIVQKAVRREEITGQSMPGTLDTGPDASGREHTHRRIESDFNHLQDIRQALDRIKEGTYGSCLCCGREIGIKRLRFVPWAAYCATCQDAADRESGQPEEVWVLLSV